MSVTTTANPVHYYTHQVLADYELHHSSQPDGTIAPPNQHPTSTQSSRNPENWPTDRRRVPEYRPINRELDQSQRRVYLNTAEMVFIQIMFLGVRTNATASRVWHATGGRINEHIFRYKIGGEW